MKKILLISLLLCSIVGFGQVLNLNNNTFQIYGNDSIVFPTGNIATLNTTTGNIVIINSTTGNIETLNVTTGNIATLVSSTTIGTSRLNADSVIVSRSQNSATEILIINDNAGVDANAALTINNGTYGGQILMTGANFTDFPNTFAITTDAPNGLLINTNIRAEGSITPAGRLMIPMGEINYFNTTGTTVSITTQSDGSTNMVLVNPTTTLNNDSLFDMSADGRLRYVGTTTRTFHIACTVSFDGAGSGTNVYVFGLAKSGTMVTQSKVLQSITAVGDIQSTALHVMTTLSTNQYLELYVGNLTDADDITIKTLTLFAVGM